MSKPAALITGASRGLGAELAQILSQTHHIIAISRTIGALEALDDQIKKCGGSSTLAPIDLTDENAIAQLCRSIARAASDLVNLQVEDCWATPSTPTFGQSKRNASGTSAYPALLWASARRVHQLKIQCLSEPG